MMLRKVLLGTAVAAVASAPIAGQAIAAERASAPIAGESSIGGDTTTIALVFLIAAIAAVAVAGGDDEPASP